MNKVEIINVALARLGESAIQSLDEGTNPAISAKTVYDSARRSALAEYHWSFALSTARLAKLAEVPDGFDFAFSLPSDCLKVIRLSGGGSFAVRGGKKLLTNCGEAVVEYVRDEDDTELFEPSFVEALTYKLASELAMPVKGSAELMDKYANAYRTLMNEAAVTSISEARKAELCNPYLEARFE